MSELQEITAGGDSPLAAVLDPAAPDSSEPASHIDWVRRIRDEERLPAALRDCLAAAVEASPTVGGAEPSLTITQVAGVLADAVPSLLALAGPPEVAVHPGGEGFFRSGELSDRDASRIAAEQLARTGFGK